MSECINMEEESRFNETAGFFQVLKICKLSKLVCQGAEEICSKFEPMEEQKKETEQKEEEKQEQETETESTEKADHTETAPSE